MFLHSALALNYKVEEKSPGIYTVIGDILPIQIIDSRRLSDEENLWLKGLNRHEAQEAWRIVIEASSQGDGARIGAYLDAIVRANADVLQEVHKMSDVRYYKLPVVEEFLEKIGMIAEIEAEIGTKISADSKAKISASAEAQLEARGEERVTGIAKNLVSLGLPLETVVSATGLGIDKVKEMYNKQ